MRLSWRVSMIARSSRGVKLKKINFAFSAECTRNSR